MNSLFELGVNLSRGLRDEDKEIARVLAHTKDPQTSKDTALKMVESGKLSRQELRVYEGILGYYRDVSVERTFTARELAYWNIAFGLNYYLIQRRLSGLRNKGKIERTGEKRDDCCVWKLV